MPVCKRARTEPGRELAQPAVQKGVSWMGSFGKEPPELLPLHLLAHVLVSKKWAMCSDFGEFIQLHVKPGKEMPLVTSAEASCTVGGRRIIT